MFDYKKFLSVYACAAGYNWLSTTNDPLQAWLTNARLEWITWVVHLARLRDARIARRVLELAVDLDEDRLSSVLGRSTASKVNYENSAKELRKIADAADTIFNSEMPRTEKSLKLMSLHQTTTGIYRERALELYPLYILSLNNHVSDNRTNPLYDMLYHCMYHWVPTASFITMVKAIIPYECLYNAIIARAKNDYPDSFAYRFNIEEPCK